MKITERIVRTSYLSRWIVMSMDVVISTVVTLLAYCFVRYLRGEGIDWVALGNLAVLTVVVSGLSFAVFRTFRVVMRFTTLRETWRIGCPMLLKVIGRRSS